MARRLQQSPTSAFAASTNDTTTGAPYIENNRLMLIPVKPIEKGAVTG